jgi:hypothetical protein
VPCKSTAFQFFGPILTEMSQNQMFATDIAPSNSYQIISFKMLTYTDFHVLFSHAHNFGPKRLFKPYRFWQQA